MMNRSAETDTRRRILASAILVTFAFALVFQGSRGIWEPDEGRYTVVALEMLETGDWIHPALNHETPHYTKPPLTYWAIAGSMALFGLNTWAVRLPYALAFAFTILLVGAMGRRLTGRPLLAGLVYGVSLLPFAASNVVTTDTFLALFETLGVACFVEARWGGRWNEALTSNLWMVGFWLAFGLAFATKGPPGLLTLLAVVVFVALDEPRQLRRLLSPLGIGLFSVIAFSWFAVVVRDRPDLLGFFLGTELIDRTVSARLDRNPQWYGPLLVYGPTLVAGMLPWTGQLFGALGSAWRQWRRRGRAYLVADSQRLFLLVWIFLPLLVFCIARSRLSLYLLPLSAPLALVITRHLGAHGGMAGRKARLALAAWVVFLIGLKGVASYVPHGKDSRDFAREIAAVTTGPVEEVVFLDTHPRYGIALYLDTEVEPVTLAPWPPPPDALQRWEVLEEELGEEQETRVWVMQSAEREVLFAALREHGVHLEERGRWRDLLIAVPQ